MTLILNIFQHLHPRSNSQVFAFKWIISMYFLFLLLCLSMQLFDMKTSTDADRILVIRAGDRLIYFKLDIMLFQYMLSH